MNKTLIEWVKNPDGSQGYTLNSKSGCTNHTPEGLCLGGMFPCYAYKLAHGRLKQRYLANSVIAPFADGIRGAEFKARNDPFYPRFWRDRIKGAYQTLKSSGIFLDDMSDWMLDCWPQKWTEAELHMMRDNPWHRFYTLTKQPQNLIKFSPFPDNCWVGVTATNGRMVDDAVYYLEKIEAKVKFLSLEPLLEPILIFFGKPTINWLILGAQTKPYKPPEIEWVREIVEAADKAGIPVFLKDNLKSLLNKVNECRWAWINSGLGSWGLRQEMPPIPSE